MLVALCLFVQVAAAGEARCTSADTARLNEALQLMNRGDVAAARSALERQPAGLCPMIELARLAVSGWLSAREAARGGGAPELLAPVRAIVDQIEKMAQANDGGSVALDLQIQYAVTMIRAAMAAAQDERPEMELLLDYGGDLVQRLEQRSTRARWPRTYNLAVGELWFEVDRFEEARAAYARAAQAEPSAAALVGLARAEARLGLTEQACATYRKAKDVTTALRALAARDLARCF
jgi:tetratricopeptide (TPR) repeat protein